MATRGAAFLIAVAATFAALAWIPPATAETMVRYKQPVWRNGHRVLYHGAWRSHGHVAAKSDDEEDGDKPDKPDKPEKPAVAAKPAVAGSANGPREFIVLVDPEDATSLRMATELVNCAIAAGLKARAWAGKTSPDALQSFVDGDGGDFAVAPLDVLANDPKLADLRAKAPLVARFAGEPIAVIATTGVADLKRLDGRPVAFGEAGGVADATGQALFAKLGVKPKIVHENVAAALASLDAGRIDAMVVFGADESRAVNDASRSGKLHALAVPWRDELAGFAPARLTGRDLPRLVPAEGDVDTVSAAFGLIAVDAGAGSPRAAQDAPFVAALFGRFQPLLGTNADPRWRDVNLAAETDWPRLTSAKDWLEKHRAVADPALDEFRATARDAGQDPATSAAVADKLYADLLRTKGVGP